jgi:hypothetical protein
MSDGRKQGPMWRFTRFDWNFSSTAEIATGVLLLASIAIAVFL